MVRKGLGAFVPASYRDRLRGVRDGIRRTIVSAWSTLSSVFPDRFVLFLKTHTNLVKKLDYVGAAVYLQVESQIEYDTRLHSCAKEPETVEWIHSFFREGDVFYDIGANVGAYSLVAAKHLRGQIRVYAFEPSFPTFKQLSANIVLNGCQDWLVPLQIALSDRTGIATLNYSSLMPGGALHAVGEAVDYKGEEFRPVVKLPVLGFALDDLVRQFDLPIPSHVKLDVDGIELSILRGAEGTFRNTALRSVLVEILEGDAGSAQVIAWLERAGLRVHSRHKYSQGGEVGPASRIYNYIFSR